MIKTDIFLLCAVAALFGVHVIIFRHFLQHGSDHQSAGKMSFRNRGLQQRESTEHFKTKQTQTQTQTQTQAVAFNSHTSNQSSTEINFQAPELSSPLTKKRFLIFTMDSTPLYQTQSRFGGAAGELLIRKSLENVLEHHFDCEVTTIPSDKELIKLNGADYDYLLFDPWTWADKNWNPKSSIQGNEHKVYILDFFGSSTYQEKLRIDMKSHVLTAYGSPWNTFLGYYILDNNNNNTTMTNMTSTTSISSAVSTNMANTVVAISPRMSVTTSSLSTVSHHIEHNLRQLQSSSTSVSSYTLNENSSSTTSTATTVSTQSISSSSSSSSSNVSSDNIKKKQQGIIWGKDSKYYQKKTNILYIASQLSKLISVTRTKTVIGSNNIVWYGLQHGEKWKQLLAESKFLLGLGDPLSGPSAIDAISQGCMYINPIYTKPINTFYYSQHPYAMQYIGDPYVCNYHIENMMELAACINMALNQTLQPFIPIDFQYESYIHRVQTIFDL